MNTPTPETDEHYATTKTAWPQQGDIDFARKLERERDEARKHTWNDMVCIHHTDRDRAACIGHCPVCLEAERDQLRKVCDELYECARQLGWTSSEDMKWITRAEVAIDAYNNLPHVTKNPDIRKAEPGPARATKP